jgi:aspartokinase
VETIAVYREERIRTYGFDLKTGLALITITVPPVDQIAISKAVQELGKAGFSYDLLTAHTLESGASFFTVLTNTDNAPTITDLLQKTAPGILEIDTESSVEMVHFQGPHFGDRYGIVDAALDALSEANIKPLAVCCAGSSVYMVLSNGSGQEAIEILSTPFQIPNRDKR